MNSENPGTICFIGGSDSSGWAGIEADLRVAEAFHIPNSTVLTAVTTQEKDRFLGMELLPLSTICRQLEALLQSAPPWIIKIGMIGREEVSRDLAQMLSDLKTFVVYDPVLRSTSGQSLFDGNIETVKRHLFPRVDLLTPNIPETEKLLGWRPDSETEIELAARELLKAGVKSVLLKGGHRISDFAQDFWTDGKNEFWISSPRRNSLNGRGTGCTLASAISVGLARGFDIRDAIVFGKTVLNGYLRTHFSAIHEPDEPIDLPRVTLNAVDGLRQYSFPSCGEEPLGFYPIVDRAAWVERLLPLGVKTIQIRIKDLSGEDVEHEIANSVQVARRYNARLFVNDFWKLAIKYSAYGVHLGQEDLLHADLEAIEKSGLRLGVSTHCYHEVARAVTIRLSYVAVGPIFPTKIKAMNYAPQGIAGLQMWKKLVSFPIVAIGGIKLAHARELLQAGANGIAVITDVIQSRNPDEKVKEWLGKLRRI